MTKEALGSYIQANVPIASQALAEVLAQYEPRLIRKNEFFLRQGERSNEYLFLEQGMLRAFTSDPNGNEVTTLFFGPHQVVFEVSAFFLRAASAESIQALTECTGYSLSLDRLNMLFHSVPAFREFGRKMLVQGFAAFKERALGLISTSAEERYHHLLATTPALFQHAQLRHIASYLGVTDTSLSRIRREAAKRLSPG